MCARARMCVCVRVCARACVCLCMRACVRARVCVPHIKKNGTFFSRKTQPNNELIFVYIENFFFH